MKPLLLIATKEFSDRFRSGWVIACTAVWLGAIALTSLFALAQIGRIGVQGYERTVVSLLNLVQYLVPLLALLLGHDLIVSEREERTLALMVAGGSSRARVLLGKFLGGVLTLAFPLTLGFAVAGTAIGLTAKDHAVGSFLTLALSGLVLGVVFLALGLLISTCCRTRVQALVVALLAWCAAVFVFDLVAMGVVLSSNSAQAAQEIETATDATHVNSAADLHKAFAGEERPSAAHAAVAQRSQTLASWLLLNPVDVFRAINLPQPAAVAMPIPLAAASVLLWLSLSLGGGIWKLQRIDL